MYVYVYTYIYIYIHIICKHATTVAAPGGSGGGITYTHMSLLSRTFFSRKPQKTLEGPTIIRVFKGWRAAAAALALRGSLGAPREFVAAILLVQVQWV